MQKVILTTIAAAVLGAGLTGCTPGNNTPGSTIVGAAAGGLLASTVFHGSGAGAGIVAGALIGGSIGYLVGRRMDRQDRINMENAIVQTPINEEATWTNTETHTTYVVRPVEAYHYEGRPCRRYMTKIKIDGRWRTAYGRACRTPNGWRVVS